MFSPRLLGLAVGGPVGKDVGGFLHVQGLASPVGPSADAHLSVSGYVVLSSGTWYSVFGVEAKDLEVWRVEAPGLMLS